MTKNASSAKCTMCKPLMFSVLIACCALAVSASPRWSSVPHVVLKRVPESGIQPQAALGQDGTVHLVYFRGDPSEGDLFYARSKDGLLSPIPFA